MKVYVATKNAGKLRELKAIFAGTPLELHAYQAYGDVCEDAGSYIGNALLKARALQAQLRVAGLAFDAVLADDSGLEVDALHGRPGVLSARYAGADVTWETRRAHLLDELLGVPEARRGAHFVCVMILLAPGQQTLSALGLVEGRIVERERGSGGFGYDPLFFCPPLGCTLAEVTEERKNEVSHRRRAADALLRARLSRRA